MLRHEAQKAETARVFPEHQHSLRFRLSTGVADARFVFVLICFSYNCWAMRGSVSEERRRKCRKLEIECESARTRLDHQKVNATRRDIEMILRHSARWQFNFMQTANAVNVSTSRVNRAGGGLLQ